VASHVVLVCTSQVIGNIKHLFRYLLLTYIFFEKYLFSSIIFFGFVYLFVFGNFLSQGLAIEPRLALNSESSCLWFPCGNGEGSIVCF
jgi:hypothetical protein